MEWNKKSAEHTWRTDTNNYYIHMQGIRVILYTGSIYIHVTRSEGGYPFFVNIILYIRKIIF